MTTQPVLWTQDHLVRITATLVPSSDAAGIALEEALGAWFSACTPDPDSTRPPACAALSGGSALERHRAGTAHVVVVLSGGEDGLDSAAWELERLQELQARVDPAAVLTAVEQQRHEDEETWQAAPMH